MSFLHRYRILIFLIAATLAYLYFSEDDARTAIEKRYLELVGVVELEESGQPLDLIFQARAIEEFIDQSVAFELVRGDQRFERVSSARALSDRLLGIYQNYRNLSIESRSLNIILESDTIAQLNSQVTARARLSQGISRMVEVYDLELEYYRVDDQWLIREIELTQITSRTE